MAGGYSPPPQGDYGALVAILEDVQRRLAELETPTGTSMNSLVAQVQQAIADINTTVAAAVSSTSYTQAQIDSRISAPPYAVNTSTDLTVGGQLKAPDAAAFNITGTRLTVWVETATGRFGNTASSRKYKQDEAVADVDPEAILAVTGKMFHYIAEVRKRDDPTFEEYIGPDYVVTDEYGFMAEDLHEAGLHPWVIYREVDGEMVPESVDYVMWVVALQIAIRKLASDRDALRADLASIVARVGALEALLNPEVP